MAGDRVGGSDALEAALGMRGPRQQIVAMETQIPVFEVVEKLRHDSGRGAKENCGGPGQAKSYRFSPSSGGGGRSGS